MTAVGFQHLAVRRRLDAPTLRPVLHRSPRPRSLSLRLAAVYGLLVAATVLVVAGVTVAIARAHLERALEGQLRSTAQSFQHGPGAQTRRPAQLGLETRRWLAEQPLPTGQMAAIRFADGRVLTSVRGLDLFEVSEQHALLTATRARWWNLHGSEGAVRGLTVPILAHDRQLGTLLLLAYQRQLDATLGALLSGIALASALGLAFALLLGVVVVRRSLRPLSTIAAEVAAIETTGDLSRRVGLGRADDEVGRLAGAFDRMLIRLQEAFQLQRRFLADASHELRTPLTVVRGQLEVLADQLDEGKRGSFRVATDELDRMARIVEDLLLLARLDEGLQLRCDAVEVELVLREALLRAMLLAPREVRVEAQSGLYALADPDGLLQVLTNLVTNAVKHTEEGGRIVLGSKQQGEHVVLRVSDNGSGIRAEELPHIFERFYRGATERRAAPEGSGLGLAIASSLLAAMNGAIDVRSSPTHGTTFVVRLPPARFRTRV